MITKIRSVGVVEVVAIVYHKGEGTQDDLARIGFSLYDKATGVLLCEIDNINDLRGYPEFVRLLVGGQP